MKIPCWRCVLLYLLTAPPLVAYLFYKKFKDEVAFKDAAKGLETWLAKIAEEGKKYEQKNVRSALDVSNDAGGRGASR